jgi:radical SAM superfamily enzyme YgiQ (UPF0313 family)
VRNFLVNDRCLYRARTGVSVYLWNVLRHWPIDCILLELRLLANMDFREVFMQDDTMNVDPQWAEELFHAIAGAKLGLEYKVAFRANEKLLTEPMLDAAAKAGVREIFYGVESGNEAIREAFTPLQQQPETALSPAYITATNLRKTA